MRSHLIVTAVSAAIMVAGCARTRGAPESQSPTADPVCEFAGTKARTCVVRGNKTVCNIYIGETAGRTHVYPETLSVPAAAGKVVVVWHLQVPGAKFVQNGSDMDGPKWKGSSSEFQDGEPTEDPDGAQQGRPEGRRYRITYTNGALGSHPYLIQYRGQNGIKRCDPLIVSEAG